MSYGGVTYQEVAVCEVINFGFDAILLAAICIRRGEKREHDGPAVNLATSSPVKIAGVQRQLGTVTLCKKGCRPNALYVSSSLCQL